MSDVPPSTATIAARDELPDTPRLRRDRLLSTVAAFLMTMTFSFPLIYGFLVVPGSQRFSVSTAQFLLWATLFFLSLGVASLVAGPLISRFGVRLISIVGSLGATAALVGMALVPNIALFYVLAAVYGTFYSGCSIIMVQTIVIGWHQNSARKGTIVGIVATAAAIAGFICGFTAPPLVGALGFTGSLLTVAGLMLLLAALPAIFLVRTPPATLPLEKESAAAPAEPRLSREQIVGALILVLASFLFSLENAFSGVQAAVFASRGFEATTVGLLVSLYSLTALVAKPLLGYLHDQLGSGRTLVIIGVMFAVGLPGIAALTGVFPWTVWIFLAIASISFSVVTVQIPIIASRIVSPRRFAAIYGYSVSVTWFGLAIATPLWGLTFDLTKSYDLALYLGGAVGVVGTILCGVVLRLGSKRRAAASVEPTTPVVETPP